MDARRFIGSLLAALAVTLAAAHHAAAQAGGAREILSTFPDAQAVMYIDTRRIMTEALPRVVPQAELDKMFADAQKNAAGFDPRSVHFVAFGVRLREPFSQRTPPDFVVMVKGDLNADALLSMARVAAGEAHTRETYKGRSLDLFDTSKFGRKPQTVTAGSAPQPQPPQQPPPPSPYPQLAVATLDANTLVGGVPALVRAAVDAADGEGRLRADLLDLVARNPDNLLSLAGDIPASLADLLKSAGMPQNAEIERIVRSLRQVQLSAQMTAADFGMQSIVKTDTAESANAINGMVTLGLGVARMKIEEDLRKVPANKPGEREALEAALNLVSSLRNVARDNEVQIDVAVPQATVATFVQKAMARQKEAQAAKPAPRPARRGRRGARGRN